MLLGRLVLDGSTPVKGSIKSLLNPGLRRTTILLWFIWMSCSFCYYGLVLMSTELFSKDGTETESNNLCRPLLDTDYMDLLWTTLAEFPGIFTTIAIIERFGRKSTMALQFMLFAICVMLLLATNT